MTIVKNHPLQKIMENRIAIIDGAMGTTIRTYGMTEAHIRGERFKNSPKDLLNNGDIFSLTQPEMICDIHRRFLEAGADIIETNTFGATTITQSEFFVDDPREHGGRKDPEFYQKVIDDSFLDSLAWEINEQSARQCREWADRVATATLDVELLREDFAARCAGDDRVVTWIDFGVQEVGGRDVFAVDADLRACGRRRCERDLDRRDFARERDRVLFHCVLVVGQVRLGCARLRLAEPVERRLVLIELLVAQAEVEHRARRLGIELDRLVELFTRAGYLRLVVAGFVELLATLLEQLVGALLLAALVLRNSGTGEQTRGDCERDP